MVLRLGVRFAVSCRRSQRCKTDGVRHTLAKIGTKCQYVSMFSFHLKIAESVLCSYVKLCKLLLRKTHSCFKHPTQAHHHLLGPKTRERLAWQSEPVFGIAMHQSSQQTSLTSLSLSFYLAMVRLEVPF